MLETFGFDILLKGSNMMRLVNGLGVALRISLVSAAISLLLGILFGVLLALKKPVINAIFSFYLGVVRIMPQLVLLFIVYFGATKALGIELGAEPAAIIVFAFWGTAEMADLVRGAFISIPKHQYESARALGMNSPAIFTVVILPQTVRRLLPLSINLVTRMIKTTSLVMMIGVVEVLKVGQQIKIPKLITKKRLKQQQKK